MRLFKDFVYAVFTDKLCLFIICFGTFGIVMWQLSGLAWWLYDHMGVWFVIPWMAVLLFFGIRQDRKDGYY